MICRHASDVCQRHDRSSCLAPGGYAGRDGPPERSGLVGTSSHIASGLLPSPPTSPSPPLPLRILTLCLRWTGGVASPLLLEAAHRFCWRAEDPAEDEVAGDHQAGPALPSLAVNGDDIVRMHQEPLVHASRECQYFNSDVGG
eukprot:313204-Hanusia_phi.AAC.1